MEVAIVLEDPGTDDDVRLLEAHLLHALLAWPPDHVYVPVCMTLSLEEDHQ